MIHSYDDIQQVIVYVIVIRNTVQQKREKQTFKVFSKNVPTYVECRMVMVTRNTGLFFY